ncbi:MAG: nitrogenase iron-molybdenum cofactor biosynthesis protein NifN [Actinobacteria bacterium HGW-Actinobacteria-10]|nr:MAG: nitrogenase iron-molybdenum cofactor biosynthesis protein NifN [Actinobacteria bacterium HGW-Actinobacteria-10]
MSLSLDKLLEAGCQADTEHKVCRTRGGESCAFDGAAIVLMPIADAAHVVHGPIVCAGNAWEGRGVHSTTGDFHRRGFTSDVGELDIVYGGEKRLAATIREVVACEHPCAVFVYATCVTGLIGEDLDTVCRDLSAELQLPVVPVHAPGFVGPKNLGNRIAGEVLLEHVIGTAEPDVTTPFDIALIGEYNVAGDLDVVEPLLRECGFRVLSHVTGNARFEEIRYAHRAKLSVMVCSRALINVAAGLRKQWGIPSVEVSFFGATEIARSLRAIALALEATSPEAAVAGLRERVESVIARHEGDLKARLTPYTVLHGQRAVLYSGGVKSWSMASALTDLGVEILAVGTKKSSVQDEEKVRLVLGNDARLIEDISPATIRRLFAEEGATLLVAGGRNRYLAAKEGWPFVDVNQERETAYAGYEGLVNLACDLSASVRFYERQRLDISLPGMREPAVVRAEERAGTIDALKNAPSLGAALALQGVDRAIPVLHAAQGCTFLGKVLALRHFNDPISFGTTALFTEDVVMGSDEAALRTLRSLDAASHPELVALISGGLSEVKGEDVDALVRDLDRELSACVVAVHAPDYVGGLEEGYLAAVRALITLAEEPTSGSKVAPWLVTVLAGPHLSPGDVNELRDIVESFGLEAVIVPDLSALDGSREGLSALASGGVTVRRLRELATSAHTLVIGASLEPAARDLHERFATPYTVLDAVGLRGTDALLAQLSLISGGHIAPRYERDRRVLVDAMRDAHLRISGKRIALALEPDHAAGLAAILDEMAAAPRYAVVPTKAPVTSRIQAREVIVGDFASVPHDIDLLVAGSHGRRTARVLGVPHFETGFPRFEVFGASRQMTVTYRGATAVVDAIANLLGPAHPIHYERSTS